MRYIIDTANREQIDEVLQMGIDGVTANPTMYYTNQEAFYPFIEHYAKQNLSFLSAEVMGGSITEMLEQAKKIRAIHSDIVIKINFSKEGLKVCSLLHKQGYRCAMTLLFTLPQVCAALQAGADYIFPFIGRNDEIGADGLSFIKNVQRMIDQKKYSTKVVAASIKNLHQLEELATMGVDYAAVPYALYMKSLEHSLTTSGAEKFKEDWEKLKEDQLI